MQFQSSQASIRSLISRRTQIAFAAGLILGILLGWVFSGVIGAIMKFGFVAVVLIVFLLALFFWFSVRRAPKGEGPVVYTWTSSGLPNNQDDLFQQRPPTTTRQVDQDVIDLQELKEQLRQEREP